MSVKLESIEQFMAKAQTAIRMGSKELRISMVEGNELIAAIGQVLALNVSLSQQIREMEQLVGSQLRVDGGSFD